MYLPTKDLTICVDVQPNPGPVSPQATKPPFSSFGGSFRHAVNTNLHHYSDWVCTAVMSNDVVKTQSL